MSTRQFFSCTRQDDVMSSSRLFLEALDVIPKGTFLYYDPTYQTRKGDPSRFTLSRPSHSSRKKLEIYRVKEDLPYVLAEPDWEVGEGRCWECRSDEITCYNSDLTEDLPYPCAWWKDPYLYLCSWEPLEKREVL